MKDSRIDAIPYRDRKTWLIGVREIRGWHMKVYGICAAGCVLGDTVVEAALAHAGQHVNWPDRESGFGFITLHVGEEAVWLLADLWVEDILRHFLYRAPLHFPDQFDNGPDDGTMACVWELAVFCHERDAWVKYVLSRPHNPGYHAYLSDSLAIQTEGME